MKSRWPIPVLLCVPQDLKVSSSQVAGGSARHRHSRKALRFSRGRQSILAKGFELLCPCGEVLSNDSSMLSSAARRLVDDTTKRWNIFCALSTCALYPVGSIHSTSTPKMRSTHPQRPCIVRWSLQGEDAYFNGTIAKDNGDATYEVDFDDGDVLSAAPRRDIRPILMTDVDRDESQENEVEQIPSKCVRRLSASCYATDFLL